MSRPLFSVIVPVYNVEKYLEECVKSIQNQTVKDIEIILVDDGSKDNSPKICDDFAAADERIKVIHKENAGLGFARNSGLDAATGEYISFIDSDDYIKSDMLENMYNIIEENNADMVISGIRHIGGSVFEGDGEEVINDFKEVTIFDGGNNINELMLGTLSALPHEKRDTKYGHSTCTNIYKNDIVKKYGVRFLSERVYVSEDLLFLINYIAHIDKAVGIPEAYYCYRRNEGSLSKSYREDRFTSFKNLLCEVEKIFLERVKKETYLLYRNRIVQALARVCISQEILREIDEPGFAPLAEMNIKNILNDSLLTEALKKYPYFKLPVMQAVMAFGMKYKMVCLIKLLVKLRSKL